MKEIELEKENLSLIERHDQRARRLRPLLVGIVVLNIILLIFSQYYTIAWIIASFFLYMYYFIVLLFPTTRRVRTPADKKKGIKAQHGGKRGVIRDVLRQGKKAVAVAFWNSFFIGTQTLATGITLILAIGIFFAILSAFILGTLDRAAATVIVAQSIIILLYYQAIKYYRPYSKDFSRTLKKVRRDKAAERRAYLRGVAIAVIIITVFAILVYASIFLPKEAVGRVLQTFDVNAGYTIAVIVLIFVSQFVVVRYIQGFDSARITTQFIKAKLAFLQGGILLGLDDLEKQPEGSREEGRFQALKQRFYASKIYKIAYKDLFGILPTYPIIVDFKAILGKDVAAALGDEIPLDIPSGSPS